MCAVPRDEGAGAPRTCGESIGVTVIGLLLLIVATALLVAGAELFVENAAAASRRLGVTVLAVGLLLAGRAPEELLTGGLAWGSAHPGLAAGDALGANVTMLTATLGLAALLRPVPVGHRVRVYGVLSSVAGVLAAIAVLGGHVGRLEGGLLVLAYVVLVGVIWRRERQPPSIGELAEIEEEGERDRSPGFALLLTVVGLAVMTAGGEAAVEGATRVVRSLDQSDTAGGVAPPHPGAPRAGAPPAGAGDDRRAVRARVRGGPPRRGRGRRRRH